MRAPGQLSWLGFSLTAQKNNIAALLLRLRDIGLRVGTSLALHRKFMCLLGQVAPEREKELAILNDIEDVEKYHAEQRRRKLLRQAAANDDRIKPDAQPVPQPEEKPARNGVLKWILLLAFLARRPKNDKNQ